MISNKVMSGPGPWSEGTRVRGYEDARGRVCLGNPRVKTEYVWFRPRAEPTKAMLQLILNLTISSDCEPF